jgi:hypothetical protein
MASRLARFHAPHRIVDGRREQILEHGFLFVSTDWDRYPPGAHRADRSLSPLPDPHRPRRRHLALREFLLRFLHLGLHLLRLLHDVAQTTFHALSVVTDVSRLFAEINAGSRPLVSRTGLLGLLYGVLLPDCARTASARLNLLLPD